MYHESKNHNYCTNLNSHGHEGEYKMIYHFSLSKFSRIFKRWTQLGRNVAIFFKQKFQKNARNKKINSKDTIIQSNTSLVTMMKVIS